jgi:hypothetical protein
MYLKIVDILFHKHQVSFPGDDLEINTNRDSVMIGGTFEPACLRVESLNACDNILAADGLQKLKGGQILRDAS